MERDRGCIQGFIFKFDTVCFKALIEQGFIIFSPHGISPLDETAQIQQHLDYKYGSRCPLCLMHGHVQFFSNYALAIIHAAPLPSVSLSKPGRCLNSPGKEEKTTWELLSQLPVCLKQCQTRWSQSNTSLKNYGNHLGPVDFGRDYPKCRSS